MVSALWDLRTVRVAVIFGGVRVVVIFIAMVRVGLCDGHTGQDPGQRSDREGEEVMFCTVHVFLSR